MPRFFLKIIMAVILGGSMLGGSMQAMAGTVWIDVRGADEYAAGHVPGAILIPHDQIAALIAEKVGDKHADIQLYCRSGRRADVARDVMLQMGYTRVTNHGSLENALLVAEQLSLAKQE